ncbi:hypothetical protein C8R43DRAFT_948929 [Mycena crocata]|nr:hypothetical protein C8R43DRAFT_948929 [Mycena crocata]
MAVFVYAFPCFVWMTNLSAPWFLPPQRQPSIIRVLSSNLARIDGTRPSDTRYIPVSFSIDVASLEKDLTHSIRRRRLGTPIRIPPATHRHSIGLSMPGGLRRVDRHGSDSVQRPYIESLAAEVVSCPFVRSASPFSRFGSYGLCGLWARMVLNCRTFAPMYPSNSAAGRPMNERYETFDAKVKFP